MLDNDYEEYPMMFEPDLNVPWKQHHDLATPDHTTPTKTINPDIGDLFSKAKGSGARYNSNKIPYEYLPLKTILDWIEKVIFRTPPENYKEKEKPYAILRCLAAWQNGVDDALDTALMISLDTIDLSGFAEAAQVYKQVTTRKIKPYPPFQWMKSMPWSVPFGCAIRHALAEIDGHEIDDDFETGTMLKHRAHIICNLIMLVYFRDFSPEHDDRPQKL